MKILHLAYKSEITGGEVVLWDLARGMKAAGHEVHVVAPTPGPLLEELGKEGIQTAAIPLEHLWSYGAVGELAKYMAREKIEIVQSHGLLPNIHSRMAVKKSGLENVRHVSTIHLALELAKGGRNRRLVERFKSWVYRIIDNRTSRTSDRIVCVSDYVRNDQAEQGVDGNKLVTIRNGIDPSRFSFLLDFDKDSVRESLGVPRGAPMVGTVARMSPQKDVATLVRAMPKVWEKHPQARLVLVGTGPREEEVKAVAKEVGSDRIIFTGYRSDAHRIMAAMDVFCLPSLHEGLPLVVLEAMACSLSVVCSPVPGTLEAVVEGETALVSPFGDYESFGENISRLLDDPELRNRMGAAGRGRLEKNFTSERMVGDTLELYASL